MPTAALQIERGVTAITMARQHGDPVPSAWLDALDRLIGQQLRPSWSVHLVHGPDAVRHRSWTLPT